MSAPITSRKQLLVAKGGPIEKLQLRAQSAVLQFYGIAGGSTVFSIFANQSPSMTEWAFDGPTALATGLLGTLLGAWRLQGKWKTAKARFWKDWERAQEALSYDLQVRLYPHRAPQ